MKKLVVLLALLALVAGLSTSAFAGNALGKVDSSWVNDVTTDRGLTVTAETGPGGTATLPGYGPFVLGQPKINYGSFSDYMVCIDWKQTINLGVEYTEPNYGYHVYDWATASLPANQKTGTVANLTAWQNLTTMWTRAMIDMTSQTTIQISRAGFQLATWELCTPGTVVTPAGNQSVAVRAAADGYLGLLGTQTSLGVYSLSSTSYANDFVLVADTNKQIFGVGKAVPEASTLIGFGSALVMAGPGMIGWLKRRRS